MGVPMAQWVQGRSPEASDLRAALDEVQHRIDAVLARFELLGDAERWDALAAIGELVKRADGASVRIAGLVEQASPALDAPSLARSFGYRSTRDALQHELGVTAGRATCIVRLALAATPRRTPTGLPFEPRFPHVAAAFVDGAIAIDQARAIVQPLDEGRLRVAEDDRLAAEASLVADAVGEMPARERGYDDAVPSPPEVLATLARTWLQALDPDGAEPREEERVAQRAFTLAQCRDGIFRGRVALPPDQGAAVHAVLNAYGSPRTTKGAPGEEQPADGDDRTPEQRNADVLAGIFSAHARSGDAPRPGKEAPTLLVAVTRAELERHAAGEPGFCEIVETGEVVPVQLAARMTCDAFIQPALVDDDGHVLRLGRRKRLFSRWQRLAIMLRDKHCLGCGAPASWNDVHHVRTWADGGDTDVDNGILVCSRCHTEVHSGRLRVERDGGSRWRVRRALLPPVRPPRGMARRAGSIAALGGAVERILASTR
ncbi:HNH endonuclease signature motif containing protein [Agrococcus citreus]